MVTGKDSACICIVSLNNIHRTEVLYYYYYYYYLIIIIIIEYLCAGYLQLYAKNKQYFWGTRCCSYSVVTTYSYDICDAIYHNKCFVLYISTFWSMCAVPNMAAVSSSLMLHFPGMLLRYFIIIIHLYAGNLQLYIWNKPCSCKR